VSYKGGTVDEIKNWNNKGDAPTIGTLEVCTNSDNAPRTTITVTRIRGRSSENDLYWTEAAAPDIKVRARDLTDTQIMLNHRLGMNAEEYIASSCFNEFSEASLFFLAKTKDRRELFEKLAKLDLPILVETHTSEHIKYTKKCIEEKNQRLVTCKALLEHSAQDAAHFIKSSKLWDSQHQKAIDNLAQKLATFDTDKENQLSKLQKEIEQLQLLVKSEDYYNEQIKLLGEKPSRDEVFCDSCGTLLLSLEHEKYFHLYESLEKDRRSNMNQLSKLSELHSRYNKVHSAPNYCAEFLEEESKKTNPLLSQIGQLQQASYNFGIEIRDLTICIDEYNEHILQLTLLKELCSTLRVSLLQRAIANAQELTNKYLDAYFDAEIRVLFSAEDADKLSVTIHKNGHQCTYAQLSKGQRQLLRLTFSLAVMEIASNKIGQSVDSLFLDEALDGLDSELKIKAFGLLQELATKHSSVFVIDHAPEFHSLFSNKYKVAMVDDESVVSDE
jgi:DNA repair exonuclease SbcCD ATPase subunit